MMRKSRSELMAETRARLIAAGREAFGAKGFAEASMDDLTAAVGLTRGALYHNFGDKKGLLAAVVAEVDGEMAQRARRAVLASGAVTLWEQLIAEGMAYLELALEPEVQRIVLRDGPAHLGDPSQWPSQNACFEATRSRLTQLIAEGLVVPVDPEAAARLINGAALTAAMWVAASDDPAATLPRAQGSLRQMMSGFLRG